MRRILRTLAVVQLTVTLSAGAVFGVQAVAIGRLVEFDQSDIRGQVAFLDTGHATTGLIVSGEATGLDPTQSYFSLVYDNASVPGGPHACEPGSPGALTAVQMAVGPWQVAADGTGTLFAVKIGASYASLDAIGAMSIRIVLGPPPEGFELRACGQLSPIPIR